MYLRNYLTQLQRATSEGVPGLQLLLRMDNFEWIFSFQQRFGLYHVDFEAPLSPSPKCRRFSYRDIARNAIGRKCRGRSKVQHRQDGIIHGAKPLRNDGVVDENRRSSGTHIWTGRRAWSPASCICAASRCRTIRRAMGTGKLARERNAVVRPCPRCDRRLRISRHGRSTQLLPSWLVVPIRLRWGVWPDSFISRGASSISCSGLSRNSRCQPNARARSAERLDGMGEGVTSRARPRAAGHCIGWQHDDGAKSDRRLLRELELVTIVRPHRRWAVSPRTA